MPLIRKLSTIVLLNVILMLLFVLTSYSIANDLNSRPNALISVHWNFFGWSEINYVGTLVNGNFIAVGSPSLFVDFPFWLFFVSTAINIAYIVKLLNEQETKRNNNLAPL